MSYTPGSLVWVKDNKNIWRPGQVVSPIQIPQELQNNLKHKRHPIAVVHFPRQEKYEIVINQDWITLYNGTKKMEFIKKGYALFLKQKERNVQNAIHMEHFVEDIIHFEKTINGNINIFQQLNKNKKEQQGGPNTKKLIKELFVSTKDIKKKKLNRKSNVGPKKAIGSSVESGSESTHVNLLIGNEDLNIPILPNKENSNDTDMDLDNNDPIKNDHQIHGTHIDPNLPESYLGSNGSSVESGSESTHVNLLIGNEDLNNIPILPNKEISNNTEMDLDNKDPIKNDHQIDHQTRTATVVYINKPRRSNGVIPLSTTTSVEASIKDNKVLTFEQFQMDQARFQHPFDFNIKQYQFKDAFINNILNGIPNEDPYPESTNEYSTSDNPEDTYYLDELETVEWLQNKTFTHNEGNIHRAARNFSMKPNQLSNLDIELQGDPKDKMLPTPEFIFNKLTLG